MATVPGIDVSYWDAGIDWPKVRATGQRYVFVKATEGDFLRIPPSTTTGAARKRLDSCEGPTTSSAVTWILKSRQRSLLIM